ncbi:MAG: tryptophan 2,3-dioxygenase family protein [Pseudobdellovibrionaceae bacterium]
MKYPPIHYNDYLGLDALLGAQKRKSEEYGKPAHDEMLFLIVHQAYELWFKQILFDLDSVLTILKKSPVPDNEMSLAVNRLARIALIQTHVLGQIDILETMTPLDFLEFREFLYPASGFQSAQFRMIEQKMGLREQDRLLYNQGSAYSHLKKEHQKDMDKVKTEPSLFECIEKWLERTPFVQSQDFDFWRTYQTAVVQMIEGDKRVIENNPRLTDEEKTKNKVMMDQQLFTFQSLFKQEAYEKLRTEGQFRLSFKAFHAALFILLYRDEPILQWPFKMIQLLLDIDERWTQWRYRHSLMAHRMLGRKIGTGGSSGHQYLKDATDKHKIFTDFFNMTTFLLPRSQIPPLPEAVKKNLGFQWRS